ncbi:MAG: SAM-dependent methyltransferase [Sphingobacteriales bacterium]|nr:MAG: SAM-dependent methyltransferase [Sphingobacteriales bacterium]
MNSGTLYLIPVPLAADQINTIPEEVRKKACALKYYFVENIRTARRFLKAFDPAVDIDSITFSEVNKQNQADIKLLKEWLKAGYEIGVMSEAGCPGIADPGSDLVAAAQTSGAKVVPFVGPSSIFLSLMGSGFNGQSFRFIGYLPVKDPQRTKAIKDLERIAHQQNETQIFIETPYRNNVLVEDLIKHLQPHKTKLCIAVDVTAPDQILATKTLAEWKGARPDIHKRPAIFLIHPA